MKRLHTAAIPSRAWKVLALALTASCGAPSAVPLHGAPASPTKSAQPSPDSSAPPPASSSAEQASQGNGSPGDDGAGSSGDNGTGAPAGPPPAKITLDAPPILPFEYCLPNDPYAVALTFDDGPDDYGNTSKIIDTLVAHNVPATFFINGNNWSDILEDAPATQAVQAMAQHPDLITIGNHTDTHQHLETLSQDEITGEVAAVEDKVRRITGQSHLRLTQFRAPFGEPYQHNDHPDDKVACAVAQSATHIGWAIDPDDWGCGAWFPEESVQGTHAQMAKSTQCVIDNFKQALAERSSGGIILLHSPYPYTAAALATLLETLPDLGYHFVPVEAFVKAKFGGTSDQLVPYAGCAQP